MFRRMGFLALGRARWTGARALLLGAVLSTITLGCGDGRRARSDLPYQLRCDIADSECQSRIYRSLATMLDADPENLPAIRTISPEQHAEEVRSDLDLNDLTGDDALSRGLRLLGFIPDAAESLTATQAEYFINEIGAYYSQRDQTITVIDRGYGEVDAQTLLAHEFTHAIQDRQFGINEVFADADSEDEFLGARGVVEGDATHSSWAWFYERLGYVRDEIDWDTVFDDWQRSVRDAAADSEVALIDAASGYPYPYGAELMAHVVSAKGLSGRAEVFRAPPATALELMLGYGANLPAFEFPVTAHPSTLEGYSVGLEDRFGAWYAYGFLRRRGLLHRNASEASRAWLGDRLAIYENGADVVAVWRMRFEDAFYARYLVDGMSDDAAAAAWETVLDEDEAFVFAAETVEALQAWAALPLDEIEASLVPKAARRGGGGVSVGDCFHARQVALPNPPPLSR